MSALRTDDAFQDVLTFRARMRANFLLFERQKAQEESQRALQPRALSTEEVMTVEQKSRYSDGKRQVYPFKLLALWASPAPPCHWHRRFTR